jgi:hypothetical protein
VDFLRLSSSVSFVIYNPAHLVVTLDFQDDEVFALHVAEALDRVQDVRAQLQSFVRHQATIRENTQAEHEEMVREASVTVVQQRVAFLTRIKVSRCCRMKFTDSFPRYLLIDCMLSPNVAGLFYLTYFASWLMIMRAGKAVGGAPAQPAEDQGQPQARTCGQRHHAHRPRRRAEVVIEVSVPLLLHTWSLKQTRCVNSFWNLHIC